MINGERDAGVLNSYERERKPHARAMILLALTVGRAMTGAGGPVTWPGVRWRPR